nr:hypothetical protein HUO10_005379 [Paraburkholderia busanensis]
MQKDVRLSRRPVDDADRTGLLTYLVIVQLVAHARYGRWLPTERLVKSTRIWLDASGATAGWQERMRLGSLSESVALHFLHEPRFGDPAWIEALFIGEPRLDARSPVVQKIQAACDRTLAGSTSRSATA